MDALSRLFGGSPLAVVAKLVFLSLVVGAILAALDLTPRDLVYEVVQAFQAVFGVGFDAVRNLGGIVLTGAMIVVPIWIIARIFSARR